MPPRRATTEEHQTDPVMEGGPADQVDINTDPGDQQPEPPPQDEPPQDEPPSYEELQRQLRATQERLDRLEQSRKQEPAKPQEPEEDPEPDWETLFFKDPKEALRLHEQRVMEKVERNLTSKYQQERSQQQFWTEFYQKHADLKDDNDLVQMTLQRNMGELADLPVDKAADRLADLTRERILRYSGTNTKRTKRAVAEGGGQPTPRPPEPEQNNVTTLSELIRSRRQKRTAKGTAA